MWSVLVLFFVIILQSAPALASYEAKVTNDTPYEAKVEVFEIRFIGVFNSLGEKLIAPGSVATFNTNMSFCLYRFVGTCKLPGHLQTFEMLANPEGMQCGNSSVKVILRNDSCAFTY